RHDPATTHTSPLSLHDALPIFCTCGFKICCRHTTWGTEMDFYFSFSGVVNHELYAFHSADICNFMRVRHGRDRTVCGCYFGKFDRREHAAFYMDMGVNKSG